MTNFKRAGVTAAVAAATASYVGLSNAQVELSTADLGDAAIIPYYTVQDGLRTGVHIINTSAATQVVKFRMRRGSDSLDALDFNVIMSPQDEWVASISKNDDDQIVVTTADTTCTAPAQPAGGFVMPETFSEGAEEGYIEVIGMGQPVSEALSLPVTAKHGATGVPLSCDLVRDNFFRVPAGSIGNVDVKGVHLNSATASPATQTDDCDDTLIPECGITFYEATDNSALKVSYFVRDSEGGLEFGNNAVHLSGFSDVPRMTNQQALITVNGELQFDPLNFELPNLDGGPYDAGTTDFSATASPFGKYNEVRAVLGGLGLVNDWSARATSDFSVNTDWVVTIPGQYLMVNWAEIAFNGSAACGKTGADCISTDLPVSLGVSLYDREEGQFASDDGELSVSPGGGEFTTDTLENEVNVLQFATADSDANVLGSQYAKTVNIQVEADNGWAKVNLAPFPAAKPTLIYYPDPNSAVAASGGVPAIGFAVWERNFGANAAANYGRAIDHSYSSN
ncbi:hypothetical protein [Parahalioglobus pacificus]|uniref:Uncharacterized protein n=1 Tax=Parahalioglobus pacificus TaxID=930806 RepID=A0A919CN61_9GAMM|nr:hypothetical protein [Halioglobus pacificus]GHD37914.1 hypothetical protein GCM10007053_27570 [Halioglobus pacificus]